MVPPRSGPDADPVTPIPPVLVIALLAGPRLVALAAQAGGEAGIQATTDPLSQLLVAAILVLVFVLLVRESAHRVLVIFGAVALLLGITYLTPFKLIGFAAAQEALDLNVLFLLAGMMAVVGVLKTTGVFPWAVSRLLARAGGRADLTQLILVWFTGLVSALADNVTTVIFLTPMAIEMARRTGVGPTTYLLPMVLAANIGGAATLIGDPPNILIGSGAGLTFMDFVLNLTVPVLWMMLLLEWFSRRAFRSELRGATLAGQIGPAPPIHDPTLLRWTLVIGSLVFLGFVTHGLTGMPVAIPAVIGAAAVLIVQDGLYLRRHRPTHAERVHGLLDVIENEIEWPTLSFFAFLFIAVGAAVETGLIDTLARGLVWIVEAGSGALALSPAGTILFAALVVCWVSGVLSALVDNIPFVAVAIPIVARLAADLPGETTVLWWSLALGACLGGNGSPIGASANVTVIGLAEREGHRIRFAEFLRLGARVTALTLAVSSLFLVAHARAGAEAVFRIGGLGFLAVVGLRVARRASRVARGR